MGVRLDLTNEVFGHWLVLEPAERSATGKTRWLCRCCACGTEKPVQTTNLRNGATLSCGCQQPMNFRRARIQA